MSYQNIDMTFIFLSPFVCQGGKLFVATKNSSPSRKFPKIMLHAYSIKGFCLLTKSQRVGNFSSKWERIRPILKSFPPFKSLQPQGIGGSRWESGKLFLKLIFESHNKLYVKKKLEKKFPSFPPRVMSLTAARDLRVGNFLNSFPLWPDSFPLWPDSFPP